MTIGSWNRDSFTAYLPTGGWTGRKHNRSWSGQDNAARVQYASSEPHEVEFVGLGAKHAREIFNVLAEHQRQESVIDSLADVANKKAKYEALKAANNARKLERLKAAYDKAAAYERLIARNKLEKQQRKAAGGKVPFNPEWVKKAPDPFYERETYIPRRRITIDVPPRVNPKPPKRKRTIPHSYTMSETLLLDALVTYKTGYNPGSWNTQPCMQMFGASSWGAQSILTDADQFRLINKLREQIQGSDFNMSVFLGEGHQTLRLIGDSAIRIAKALHHVKRGDFWGTARSLLEGTSRAPLKPRTKSLWGAVSSDANVLSARILEFQYGIKPLLHDVVAASQQLAHELNAPAQQTYRCAVRKEIKSTSTSQWTVAPYPAPTMKAYGVGLKSHRRSLIAIVAEDKIPILPYRLGLADPEVVLWELVPWSFVADWFIPIGPYLEARAFAHRLKGTFITSDKMMGRAYPPYSQAFTAVSGRNAGYSAVQFTRSISSSLRVPMPTQKPLSAVSSFQHCLNGLALLTQFVTGYSAKVR